MDFLGVDRRGNYISVAGTTSVGIRRSRRIGPHRLCLDSAPQLIP